MNNEEKILTMLEKLNGTVEKQGEILTQHSEILKQHSEILSDLQKTVTRVAVTQESVVIPQIKLLAEGHTTLLETLARKDRVEALEEDVALLKTVITAMSQRLTELEKVR